MIKEAIEKILDLDKAEVVEVDGLKLSKKQLHLVKPDLFPEPKTLTVNTLTGLVDYCKAKLDDSEKYVIHVQSPNEVNVYGEFEPTFGRRKKYLSAVCRGTNFQFEKDYLQESFIVSLLTEFEDAFDRSVVSAAAGNISSESGVASRDDGITQEITVKSGIKRLSNVDVPNPVRLSPCRSFVEIEQVDSLFVFRIKKIGDSPAFSLHDVNSDQWRVDAILRIKQYLLDELEVKEKDSITVIA